MSLRSIVATFQCDGCGNEFRTVMDPALEVKGSLHDAAEYSMREDLCTAMYHERHLCDSCTRAADSIGEEEYTPSWDEIQDAIDHRLRGRAAKLEGDSYQ